MNTVQQLIQLIKEDPNVHPAMTGFRNEQQNRSTTMAIGEPQSSSLGGTTGCSLPDFRVIIAQLKLVECDLEASLRRAQTALSDLRDLLRNLQRDEV